MRNNPYVGPRPYERQDRVNFYGRNRESRDLLALILSERVVLFYAQSGAGKTSLLNAQIVPALEEEGFEVLPLVRVSSAPPPDLDPATIPNIFVFSALLGLAGPETPVASLGTHTLRSFLEERTCGREKDPFLGTCPLLLIFDQFEELFTTHRDRWAEARGFFQQVGEALDALPFFSVIFSMREDYVAELDPYTTLVPNRLRARYRMEPLGREGALEAVTRPARQAGCTFAPGVAERLVDDLRRMKGQAENSVLGPYVEPVQLQVVCHQLWNGLPEECATITAEDVEKYGNVDRALIDFYESVLGQTLQETGVSERQLRHWFTEQLITPMQTRGLALRGRETTEGLPNAAVNTLERRHLIHADVRAGARWYELSHDRLVDPIVQSNQLWETARQTPLRLAAQRWQETKNEGLFYRGESLQEALTWAASHPEDVEPYETEFLQASEQAQLQYEHELRSHRRIRTLAITATVVSVIAVLALIAAMRESRRADRQAGLATIRELIAQSAVVLNTYPQRSLLLALEALQSAQEADEFVPAAEDTLRRALANSGGEVLSGYAGAVSAATFSPDHHWLATGSADAAVVLWDLQKPYPATAKTVLHGHEKTVQALAFSADGRWLATAGADMQIRLWDLAAPDPAATGQQLRGHTAAVRTLAFSPNGHWLLSGSDDGTAQLWELTTAPPQARFVLSGHQGAINAVAISPDQQWAATGSADGTACLWNLTAANPAAHPIILPGHRDAVWTLAFSPDSRWLATGSVDATARLWNLTATDPATNPLVLQGHEEWIYAVAFSADGHWLVTAGVDAKPRLWDLTAVDPTARPTVLYGHTDQIWSIAISADSRWLITGSRDTTARVWDLAAPDPGAAPIVLRAHEGAINAVAISGDNRWLVTASADQTARLWGLTTPESPGSPMVLRGHTGVIRSVPISANGHWLVTASGDGTARVWDLTQREPAATSLVLRGHEGALHIAALSPDSHWLATGGQDATARLWDLLASDPVTSALVLSGHKSNVRTLDFSPDSHWLATGSRDATVRLWELTASDPTHAAAVLQGHTKQVRVVAFSPDGRWLVTGGDDGVPRLWPFTGATTANSIPLPGHQGAIRAVAFSPGGHWLVTGGDDGVPRLWDLQSAGPATTGVALNGHTGVIRAAVFIPLEPGETESRWLITGSADTTAILWDLTELTEPAFVLQGHDGEVRAVAVSPGGHWLLTGSEDGTARLWDLTSEDPTADSILLAGHQGPVWTVAFSANGRWIATGGQDGTARLWTPLTIEEVVQLACHIAGRNLTAGEWEQYFGDETYRRTCPNLPLEP